MRRREITLRVCSVLRTCGWPQVARDIWFYSDWEQLDREDVRLSVQSTGMHVMALLDRVRSKVKKEHLE
jgi:hypothetical protein